MTSPAFKFFPYKKILDKGFSPDSSTYSPDGRNISLLFDDCIFELNDSTEELILIKSMGLFFPVKTNQFVSAVRYTIDIRGFLDLTSKASFSLLLLLGSDHRAIHFRQGTSVNDEAFNKRFIEIDSDSHKFGLPLSIMIALKRQSERSNGFFNLDSIDIGTNLYTNN